MSNYKLVYFDIDGGRAEPIRIAFHAAGVKFKDQRISFADFGSIRSTARFNCIPVLEIDGAQITQSNALCRYVGKIADLYPADNLQALYCDEVMDAVEDLLHHIVPTFSLEGDALKQAREALVSGWMTIYLKGLEELLIRGGGKYFSDNRLTIADIKVFVQTRSLCAGILDHVPTDLIQQIAPRLIEHQELVSNEPVVVNYYASLTK